MTTARNQINNLIIIQLRLLSRYKTLSIILVLRLIYQKTNFLITLLMCKLSLVLLGLYLEICSYPKGNVLYHTHGDASQG